MKKDINSKEKICTNCAHFNWAVGIGLGMRCGNPINNHKILRPGAPMQKLPFVPGRSFSCEHFEYDQKALDQMNK
jgi:hypothetical protein